MELLSDSVWPGLLSLVAWAVRPGFQDGFSTCVCGASAGRAGPAEG